MLVRQPQWTYGTRVYGGYNRPSRKMIDKVELWLGQVFLYGTDTRDSRQQIDVRHQPFLP